MCNRHKHVVNTSNEMSDSMVVSSVRGASSSSFADMPDELLQKIYCLLTDRKR